MSPDRRTDDTGIDPGHEQLLRSVLDQEARSIDPDVDADDLRLAARRLDARRRRRSGGLIVVSAAALFALALVGVTQLGDDEPTVIDTAEGSTTTLPDDGTSDPTPTPTSVTDAPGIFPFHTGTDADSWYDDWSGGAGPDELGAIGDLDATDPAAIGRAFGEDYLGMVGAETVEVRQGDPSSWEVDIRRRADGPTTTLFVRRLGTSAALTVTGAVTSNISLSQPAVFDEISNPVNVEGTSTAFEGTVVVQVRSDGQWAFSEALAVEPLIGGANGELGPLTGKIAYSAPTSPFGTIVALTSSAADGVVEEATVVRIAFADHATQYSLTLPESSPLAADDIVGVRFAGGDDDPGTHEVEILSAADGSLRRSLATFETTEGGVLDLAVSADREIVFVAHATSACGSTITALAADGTGEPVDLGPGEQLAPSPDGTRLVAATDDDCDGDSELRLVDLTNLGPGSESRWPDLSPDNEFGVGQEDGTVRITSLAWLDITTVAYVVQYEDGTELHLHDLTDGSITVGVGGQVVPTSSDGAMYTHVRTATGSGDLGVVQVQDQLSRDEALSASFRIIDESGVSIGDEIPLRPGGEVTGDALPLDVAGIEPVWVDRAGAMWRVMEMQIVRLRDSAAALVAV